MQRRFLFATSSSIYGNSKLCPNIHKFMIGLEILDFMLAYYISQGYLEKQNYLYTLFLSHFSVFISLCVTASLSLPLSICMCVYFSVFSLSHTQRHTIHCIYMYTQELRRLGFHDRYFRDQHDFLHTKGTEKPV